MDKGLKNKINFFLLTSLFSVILGKNLSTPKWRLKNEDLHRQRRRPLNFEE